MEYSLVLRGSKGVTLNRRKDLFLGKKGIGISSLVERE